jgi:hypothetical protein
MRVNIAILIFLSLVYFPLHEVLKTTCKNNVFQFRNISGKHRNRKTESPLGNSPVERKPQTLTGNHHLMSLCTCAWLTLSSVCPAPLLVVSVPARRFVSGLTLKFTHCVSCTVIRGGVVSSLAVHLQIQCVLGNFSGDSESALHGVCIICATTITTNG